MTIVMTYIALWGIDIDDVVCLICSFLPGPQDTLTLETTGMKQKKSVNWNFIASWRGNDIVPGGANMGGGTKRVC